MSTARGFREEIFARGTSPPSNPNAYGSSNVVPGQPSTTSALALAA
jgi:hypothetical protein